MRAAFPGIRVASGSRQCGNLTYAYEGTLNCKLSFETEQQEADQAKILVVDDRAENLLVTRTMLDELGHQVVTVRSGDEPL